MYPYALRKQLASTFARQLNIVPRDQRTFLVSDLIDLSGLPEIHLTEFCRELERVSATTEHVLSTVSTLAGANTSALADNPALADSNPSDAAGMRLTPVTDPTVKDLMSTDNSLPKETELFVHLQKRQLWSVS